MTETIILFFDNEGNIVDNEEEASTAQKWVIDENGNETHENIYYES